jgi:GH25 family lysozyme M1 (1,4-beta-N-acetylmuramidase)
MSAHATDISGHQRALLGRMQQFLATQRPGRPELVVCKATEAQGFTDSTFVPFILELEAEHVEHLGAYHFAWGNRSGVAQARHFFQTAGGVVVPIPILSDVVVG